MEKAISNILGILKLIKSNLETVLNIFIDQTPAHTMQTGENTNREEASQKVA